MKYLLFLMLILNGIKVIAQKPVITADVYEHWPTVNNPMISNNGKFVVYNIENLPKGGRSLVMRATSNSWEKQIKGLSTQEAQITGDSRQFVVKKGLDSLAVYTLGTDLVDYVLNISSFKLLVYKQQELLCYSLKDKANSLEVRNLRTDCKWTYPNVTSWQVSENGKMVVCYKSNRTNSKLLSLYLINLSTGTESKIWEGKKTDILLLDDAHDQIIFKVADSVFQYKSDLDQVVCLMDGKTPEMSSGLSLRSIVRISKDGKRLFIYLKRDLEINISTNTVEIWSYRNEKLWSEQQSVNSEETYLGVLDLTNKKIICLQQSANEHFWFPSSNGALDTIALVSHMERLDEPWSIASKINWSLVSIKSGNRRSLDFLDGNMKVSISPLGKYLVYFDTGQHNYLSYEITTGIIRNLTNNLNVSWMDLQQNDRPIIHPRGTPIWSENDKSFLIYDQNDIWEIDPSSGKKPINLTNGYGKKNQIVFSLMTNESSRSEVTKQEGLYLSAYNLLNKNNGFFLQKLSKLKDPEQLTMGGYIFNTNMRIHDVPEGSNFQPIKARNKNIFLVRRMSSTESANYYTTTNFKDFRRLSNLAPEKEYNWYTTELHSWRSLNGEVLQGVMYKPENFDPNKKYPVIFHYYERKSYGMNAYIKPEALCGNCNINIPTYVSQGYIVFSPDIHYKIGDPMQGAYDSIISAASYLSNLSYINTTKMGLQGCSFGSIQTNYLITQTELFSAAVSASGISDWVSAYGSLYGGTGSSQQNFYESGQIRMGATLWKKPDSYIKNSAIFNIHKIKTPVLLMTDRNDGVCQYPNTLELFSGLRRTGKKAWMLVYSNGNHGVEGEEAKDFSARMMQFFNHYLKDRPAPLWMLDNMSQSAHAKNEDLLLDTTGRTPGPGLLTKKELHEVDSLKFRNPVKILLR